MTLKYVPPILLALIFTTTILEGSVQNVNAVSPSFVRQEIKDEVGVDGWNYLNNEFTKGHKYADLSSISYSSNGRFLNATLFFKDPVKDKPIVNFTAYGMLIDIDSNYNTGWQGYDYMMRVSWDNNTKQWIYLLQEWSSDPITRQLYERDNFTDFIDGNVSRYVYLSLDLQKVNFPDKYIVVFFTDYDFQEGNVKYQISDFSNAVRVPPPEFVMSTEPNSVSIRPGEKKAVEVQINASTAVFDSHVNLSTNNINGLQTYFTPNELDIPPIGVATSHLNIKALTNSEPNPYTIQIFANISFPIQFSGGESQVKVISEGINEHSNLPITVLEPLTAQEHFVNFWSAYGDPINLIAGGFAAGFAALVFNKLSKPKQQEGTT